MSNSPMNFKAEQLSRVLNEAKDAKPIEGMNNTYTPEEYSKLFRANYAMAELESTDFLVPQIDTAAFEYDKTQHRPRSIARYKPAMLDLNILAANLYQADTIERTEEYSTNEEVTDDKGKKTSKVVKKTKVYKDKVVKVIFGQATVQAIRDLKEIGNSVKAQVFVKRHEEGADWEYQKAELVPKDEAYKFTKTLEVKSAIRLMRKMQESQTSEQSVGDSLEDVA